MLFLRNPSPGQKRRMVAVVDGDRAVREAFSVLLDGVGYAVAPVNGGRELLGALPEFVPDCLLLEVDLPDIDGRQLVSKIHDKGLRMPTILMSTHARALDEAAGVFSDVTTFLTKPIAEESLFKAIDQSLSAVCAS